MAAKVNKELLIETVKKYPCLYDTSQEDHKDDGIRENAWKMVCYEILNRDKDEMLQHEEITLVKKVFRNLRDRFMKVRKPYLHSIEAGMPIEPSWPYFKQLQFLEPFVKHRRTIPNFSLVDPHSPVSFITDMSPRIQSRKRKTSQDDGKNEPVAAQDKSDVIPASSSSTDPDEDDLFAQSIGKQLKRLNDFQKSLAKLKIQQVLHEVKWQTET